MDALELVARWAELFAAAFAALGALGYGIRRMYKMAKNIETLVNLTVKNNHEIQEIKSQFFKNGGGSLRDAIDRIEKRVKVLEAHEVVRAE